MSLARIVALMVRETGEATVEDLLHRLDGKYTAPQIRRAIANSMEQGLIQARQARVIPAVYIPRGEMPKAKQDVQGRIEEIVVELGKATASEIAEAIPGMERFRVVRALDGLRDAGRVEAVRRMFMGDTERDSCYYVPPGYTVRFNSVFDYAQRA